MENISLIPKREKEKERSLPRFASFQRPPIEFTVLAKIGLGLIAGALVLGGGVYFWKYSLIRQVESFNEELQNLTSQRDMSLESRLKDLNGVLEVFKDILDEHRYWSLVFKILEDKTLNSVTFKSFDGDETNNEFFLSGVAPSYGVLARQVKIFEDSPNVSAVSSSNISVSENGQIKFSIKINFSRDLILKK